MFCSTFGAKLGFVFWGHVSPSESLEASEAYGNPKRKRPMAEVAFR